MGKQPKGLHPSDLIADRCEAPTAAGRQCNHSGSIILLGVRLCSQHANSALATVLAEAKRARVERTLELRQATEGLTGTEPQETKAERKRRKARPAPSGEAEMLEQLKRQVEDGSLVPMSPRYGLHRRLKDRGH